MKKLNIALVAHDARKQELVKWCTFNSCILKHQNLFATGTTGSLLAAIPVDSENTEYPLKDITLLKSGPLGGDQQIGAMIAEGKLDALIFFCDNLITQGHQQDVGALTRLASLYNIAFATNRTTADMIITSPLFGNEEYERIIPLSIKSYENRKLTLK